MKKADNTFRQTTGFKMGRGVKWESGQGWVQKNGAWTMITGNYLRAAGDEFEEKLVPFQKDSAK